MTKYRVHVFAVVRVPIEVSAEDHLSAMKAADEAFDPSMIWDKGAEFAEEFVDYCVDEIGEDGQTIYENEAWFKPGPTHWIAVPTREDYQP